MLASVQLPARADEARIDDAKCIACHKIQMQTFKAGAHGRAFYGDALAGCQNCHGGGAQHIKVVAHVLSDVNQNYPLKNDRLACKTSHLSGFSGCFLDTD